MLGVRSTQAIRVGASQRTVTLRRSAMAQTLGAEAQGAAMVRTLRPSRLTGQPADRRPYAPAQPGWRTHRSNLYAADALPYVSR